MKRLPLGTVSLLVFAGMLGGAGALAAQRNAGVPSGTEIKVRLNQRLQTETARAGETFSGTLAQAVVSSSGQTLLARGARVNGRVLEAVSSGRLKKPASITLELTSVSKRPLRIDGKSHLVHNAELIGGGAAAGALIGALLDGKKGAAIGAGVGAGAGTAGAYMTGKKEIVLPAETELTFVAGTASSAYRAPASQRTSESRPRRQEYSRPAAPQPSYRQEEMRRSEGAAAYGGVPEFSSRDRSIIRDYYARNTGNLPPGLAKRNGNLPPGLERHLQRDGTLPPGLQKRVEPFPQELSRQLPPLPSGYTRVMLAGKALIIDSHNKIFDIFAVVQ